MDNEALSQRRSQYETEGFSVAQADADPLDQFDDWYAAVSDQLDQPNAMVVATADADGNPDPCARCPLSALRSAPPLSAPRASLFSEGPHACAAATPSSR